MRIFICFSRPAVYFISYAVVRIFRSNFAICVLSNAGHTHTLFFLSLFFYLSLSTFLFLVHPREFHRRWCSARQTASGAAASLLIRSRGWIISFSTAPSEYPLVTAPLLTKHVISLVYDVWSPCPLTPRRIPCHLLLALTSAFVRSSLTRQTSYPTKHRARLFVVIGIIDWA